MERGGRGERVGFCLGCLWDVKREEECVTLERVQKRFISYLLEERISFRLLGYCALIDLLWLIEKRENQRERDK